MTLKSNTHRVESAGSVPCKFTHEAVYSTMYDCCCCVRYVDQASTSCASSGRRRPFNSAANSSGCACQTQSGHALTSFRKCIAKTPYTFCNDGSETTPRQNNTSYMRGRLIKPKPASSGVTDNRVTSYIQPSCSCIIASGKPTTFSWMMIGGESCRMSRTHAKNAL